MIRINQRYLLMPAVLIALILAFVFVQPVHADDGTTADATAETTAEVTASPEVTETPTPTLEATETAAVQTTATESAAVQTTATESAAVQTTATESAAVQTTATESAAVQTTATESAAVQITATESVAVTETPEPTEEAVPDETEDTGSSLAETLDELAGSGLELVDASGESVSVVSRDSGDLLVDGDPYFSVGSVTYHFVYDSGTSACDGIDNCVASLTPIQAALDYMTANSLTPSDRKLYIEADTYTESVLVDGSLNGVKGLTGLVGLGDTADDVVITGSITVTNMTAGFSLTNLSVTNSTDTDAIAIYMHDNAGTVTLTDVNATASAEDGAGLVLKDTGNVTLNRVDASDNGYVGAWIETGGTVTITNSSFNGNMANFSDGNPVFDYGSQKIYSLYIYAWGGATTLNGVTADDNLGPGASISNTNPIVIKNSSFSDNGTTYSDDDLPERPTLTVFGNVVTLDGVTASGNGTISNSASGLYIQATTSLTATHINASNNSTLGMYVFSCRTGICDVAGKITLSDVRVNNNGSKGIVIRAGGAVTLYDVTADNNGQEGIVIDNASTTTAAMPVTLTLIEASNNSSGVDIQTHGAVKITNIVANDNTIGEGISISSDGLAPIIITMNASYSRSYNETSGNASYGLEISASGPVTVLSLNATDNNGSGIYVNNAGSSTALTTIKVVDAKVGNAQYTDNDWYGIEVYSNGPVAISNVDASNNGSSGLSITVYSTNAAVTVSNGDFSSNSDSGLLVDSRGLITLLNISANSNDSFGASLDNQVDGVTAGVTINASKGLGNSFISNRENGLEITTNGAVTITNIVASKNREIGLYIYNTGTGAITLKQSGSWTLIDGTVVYGNVFSNNADTGLSIFSYGPVTVAFYQATDNGGDAIYIDNSSGSGAITLNGASTYADNVSGNVGSGLELLSTGNIIVNRVDASANGASGGHLVNDGGSGLVTITYGYFDGNLYGLYVSSTNNITWKNGSVNNNTNSGAVLYNNSSLYIKPVALTNITANHNGQDGIEIGSNGLVTLTNVSASDNSVNGIPAEYGYIYNDNLSEGQTWTFDGTDGDNVTVAIDSSNFTAVITIRDENGNLIASGLDSVNVTLAADGVYTIYFEVNSGDPGYYSMDLHSDGSGTGRGTVSYPAYGIEVSNVTGTNAGVILKNSTQLESSNNSAGNVYVSSNGAITITNMIMNNSGSFGLYADNSTATIGTPAVTLTGVIMNNNAAGGVLVMTLGAVKVKDLTANGNSGDGLSITNSTGSALSLVSLTGVTAAENDGTGIYVSSNGAVTLLTVTANRNDGDGLNVSSLGAVTATTINASLNGGMGMSVSTNGAFTLKKPSSGQNHFDDNQMDGLYVSAGGKVTLTRVTADGNGYYGGDTALASATGINVSISDSTGASAFLASDVTSNGNSYTGFNVVTNGAVTISLLEANDNTDAWGLAITQDVGTVGSISYAYPITLSKINTNNNGFDGIYVDAVGNITLSKFTSNYNGGAGVSMNNNSGIGSITILNPGGARYYNQAIGNGGVGVNIESNGIVKVTGLVVEDNYYDGLSVRNNTASTAAAVTLTSIYARNNGTNGSASITGVFVKSHGVVTISYSLSTGNRGDGFQLFTQNQNIIITSSSSMGNGWDGFYADLGTGILTLKYCTWFGNGLNNLEYIASQLIII